MEKSIETFKKEWELKDESENFAQHHDNDIIKKDKRAEMEREVKAEMLEALKDELKNLKATLEKDKAAKGKKGKGGKDKKGKGAKVSPVVKVEVHMVLGWKEGQKGKGSNREPNNRVLD